MNDSGKTPRVVTSPSITIGDSMAPIDMVRMRAYRLSRLQKQLRERDYGACLLFNPIHIRYATGSRNFPIWGLYTPGRCAVVPAEGRTVLFEFSGCEHLPQGLETIEEIRPTTSWFHAASGPRIEERAARWAAEIVDVLVKRCGGNRRLATDTIGLAGIRALMAAKYQLFDAEECVDKAGLIKSPDEIACMGAAVAVCETGIARMRAALVPGITENQLWSLLHQEAMAGGSEWLDTRLLSSGGRTNPWYQEASDRRIRAGELVAFDTDMIGLFGYAADVSRTFHCGPGKPTEQQRSVYRLAHENIHHNLNLLRPGITFRELSDRGWKLPDRFVKNRYTTMMHGVGMRIGYPQIVYPQDWESSGYDGVLEEGMTLCVESYLGADDEAEGVKLEQQVLITARAYALLSNFPFEDSLLV
jgi:Xaa-Pro dipeptidase